MKEVRRPSERTLARQAATELRDAGYWLVEEDVPVGSQGRRQVRADVVAWSSDQEGHLIPDLLIEVKRGPEPGSAPPSAALQQLAVYADLLGARRAACFTGKWWLASSDFLEFEPLGGPPTPLSVTPPRRADPDLAKRVVLQRLREGKGKKQGERAFRRLVQVAREIRNEAVHGSVLGQLVEMPDLGPVLTEAIYGTLFPHSPELGTQGVPWDLATALAEVLDAQPSEDVIDPFCGLGATLAAVSVRRRRQTGGDGKLIGIDTDTEVLDSLRDIFYLTGARLQLRRAGAIEGAEPLAPRLVTVPPFGPRPKEPVKLASGLRTRDPTAPRLDAALARLSSGGRAVLIVPPSFLFGKAAEEYRRFLSETLWVASVISLPSGSLGPSTVTSVAIVVLVKEPAGGRSTLVADLQTDWADQLSAQGDFMAAFRAHLAEKSTS